jgi:chemotaxis response regulator CheB
VTLDVEMPNMSGLAFLEKIMRLRPMPVVMVSSHTQSGTEATLEALALGAVDCVAKPADSDFSRGFADLAEKVKTASRAQIRPHGSRAAVVPQPERRFTPNGQLSAHRYRPTHARQFHARFRRTAQPDIGGRRQRGQRRRASAGWPCLCRAR